MGREFQIHFYLIRPLSLKHTSKLNDVNFANNVITGKTVTASGTTYTLREYVNTNYVLSIEPVRVQ